MFDVLFPVTDGAVAGRIRDVLDDDWSPVTVQRKRPPTMPQRLVTVRNDSGPAEDVRSLRRYGINVWADDPVEAEQIALAAMQACRTRMGSILFTDQFSGPFEIEDEPAYTHGGNLLTHFYFTFRAIVRGS